MYPYVKPKFYVRLFHVIFSLLSVVILCLSLNTYIEEILSKTNDSIFLVIMSTYVMVYYLLMFCFNTFFISKIFDIYINDMYVKTQNFETLITHRLDERPVVLHHYLYIAFIVLSCFFLLTLIFIHFMLSTLIVGFEHLDFKIWMYVISLQVLFNLLIGVYLKAKIYN